MPRNIRKILRELKKGLTEIYGDQLKSVILFGSYARGDHTPASDVDLLVVLRESGDRPWERPLALPAPRLTWAPTIR